MTELEVSKIQCGLTHIHSAADDINYLLNAGCANADIKRLADRIKDLCVQEITSLTGDSDE